MQESVGVKPAVLWKDSVPLHVWGFFLPAPKRKRDFIKHHFGGKDLTSVKSNKLNFLKSKIGKLKDLREKYLEFNIEIALAIERYSPVQSRVYVAVLVSSDVHDLLDEGLQTDLSFISQIAISTKKLAKMLAASTAGKLMLDVPKNIDKRAKELVSTELDMFEVRALAFYVYSLFAKDVEYNSVAHWDSPEANFHLGTDHYGRSCFHPYAKSICLVGSYHELLLRTMRSGVGGKNVILVADDISAYNEFVKSDPEGAKAINLNIVEKDSIGVNILYLFYNHPEIATKILAGWNLSVGMSGSSRNTLSFLFNLQSIELGTYQNLRELIENAPSSSIPSDDYLPLKEEFGQICMEDIGNTSKHQILTEPGFLVIDASDETPHFRRLLTTVMLALKDAGCIEHRVAFSDFEIDVSPAIIRQYTDLFDPQSYVYLARSLNSKNHLPTHELLLVQHRMSYNLPDGTVVKKIIPKNIIYAESAKFYPTLIRTSSDISTQYISWSPLRHHINDQLQQQNVERVEEFEEVFSSNAELETMIRQWYILLTFCSKKHFFKESVMMANEQFLGIDDSEGLLLKMVEDNLLLKNGDKYSVANSYRTYITNELKKIANHNFHFPELANSKEHKLKLITNARYVLKRCSSVEDIVLLAKDLWLLLSSELSLRKFLIWTQAFNIVLRKKTRQIEEIGIDATTILKGIINQFIEHLMHHLDSEVSNTIVDTELKLSSNNQLDNEPEEDGGIDIVERSKNRFLDDPTEDGSSAKQNIQKPKEDDSDSRNTPQNNLNSDVSLKMTPNPPPLPGVPKAPVETQKESDLAFRVGRMKATEIRVQGFQKNGIYPSAPLSWSRKHAEITDPSPISLSEWLDEDLSQDVSAPKFYRKLLKISQSNNYYLKFREQVLDELESILSAGSDLEEILLSVFQMFVREIIGRVPDCPLDDLIYRIGIAAGSRGANVNFSMFTTELRLNLDLWNEEVSRREAILANLKEKYTQAFTDFRYSSHFVDKLNEALTF